MPKNSEDVDEAAETMELDGTGKKDGTKNAKRQRQRRSRNNRVKIIGITAAAIIVIVIIVGAWFIYTSLHDGRPEWLQTIPGLHYRPKNETVESLIRYQHANATSYRPWVDVIEGFLEEYKQPAHNVIICDFNNFPRNDYFCAVDLREIGYCTTENKFGYPRGTPCIFIKIHKFPNWIPEYYNSTSDLPEKMPTDLVEHIKKTVADNPLMCLDFKMYLEYILNDQLEKLSNMTKSYTSPITVPIKRMCWQHLWLSCEGITPVDQENIGPIKYYPHMGFRGYYFHASDTDGYLSPLVAIHLTRPSIGVLINIECKVWAPNIPLDSDNGVGVVQFEILID